MKRGKYLSLAAATILSATLAFTGCGGGGSNTSSQQQQPQPQPQPQPTPKTVTVSDGYILNATVKSGDAQAVWITESGKYQFADASAVTDTIIATGGKNDVNNNLATDADDIDAPTLKAPASYSNVNPYTTLMVEANVSAEQLANMFGFDAQEVNNFDIDVVDNNLSDQTKQDLQVYALAISIRLLKEQQNAQTAALVRGGDDIFPASSGSTSSNSTDSNSNTSTDNSTSNNDGTQDNGSQTSNSGCDSIFPGSCDNTNNTGSGSNEQNSSTGNQNDQNTTQPAQTSIVDEVKNGTLMDDPDFTDLVAQVRTIIADQNYGQVKCLVDDATCQAGNGNNGGNENNTSNNENNNTQENNPTQNSGCSNSGGDIFPDSSATQECNDNTSNTTGSNDNSGSTNDNNTTQGSNTSSQNDSIFPNS